MAVFWSDTMANAILNAIVRQVAFPLPAACYAALFQGPGAPANAIEPNATNTTGAIEAAFTGYTRAQLTTAIMAAPASRQTASSGGSLSFGTPTGALENPPTLAWIGFYSASTAGTYLGYGTLTAPVTETIGSALTIATGNLVIRQT